MRAGNRSLEVFSKAAVAPKPREGTLDDPAARKQDKAFGLIGTLDNLNRPVSPRAGHRSSELVTTVAAIGKDMPEPRVFVAQCLGNKWPAVPILNVCRMHDSFNQSSASVGDDMPLAALDAFASIIATRPAAFGGLDALAVNHPRRGAGFPAFLQAVSSNQCEVDLRP